MPIALPSFGRVYTGSSMAKETKYLSEQSLEMVTELGSPENFLDHRISKGSLFFAIFKNPLVQVNPDLTYRTDYFAFLFLNFGYLALPAKKFVNAFSRSLK